MTLIIFTLGCCCSQLGLCCVIVLVDSQRGTPTFLGSWQGHVCGQTWVSSPERVCIPGIIGLQIPTMV